MSRVENLESEIKNLSLSELQELRTWLAEHDQDIWDQQLESDAHEGRLDALAGQALNDFAENRATDL